MLPFSFVSFSFGSFKSEEGEEKKNGGRDWVSAQKVMDWDLDHGRGAKKDHPSYQNLCAPIFIRVPLILPSQVDDRGLRG